MVLSSLTGLEDLADENPRLKPWAIFEDSVNFYLQPAVAGAMSKA
jgi:hypothetical protein